MHVLSHVGLRYNNLFNNFLGYNGSNIYAVHVSYGYYKNKTVGVVYEVIRLDVDLLVLFTPYYVP